MKIAGFDIGGANTDLAIVDFDEKGKIKNISVAFEYLPMWSNSEDLGDTLLNLIQKIDDIDSIDGVAISMTAELVDAYKTKKEGVLDISKRVSEVFKIPICFVGTENVLNLNQVQNDPLNIAAANWIATSKIAAKINPNCILLDIGSTTTDIIPIKNGQESAKGRSDFERLTTGELVYTGTLRTNLVSFLKEISVGKNSYNLASELFAITADVYRVLSLIEESDYICDTCDGKGKSKKESARRISRVLCADLDILSNKDILDISRHIHSKQIEQIAIGIKKVASRENLNFIVITGLGKDILGYPVANLLNMKSKSMNEILTDEECIVAPAIGTSILGYEFFNK